MKLTTDDIQRKFTDLVKMGTPLVHNTIEVVGAAFLADKGGPLYGVPNAEHPFGFSADQETTRFKGVQKGVGDVYWKNLSDAFTPVLEKDRSYGWNEFSKENNYQLAHVVRKLQKDPDTRQACSIFTNPGAWEDVHFGCINAVNYFLRNNKLDAVVQARSLDACNGYPHDFVWQKFVMQVIVEHLNLDIDTPKPQLGNLTFHVGTLHVYEYNLPK